MKPDSVGKDKFNSRWDKGSYAGHLDETGEIIIGTVRGMLKVRTVRRFASQGERWSAEAFDKV